MDRHRRNRHFSFDTTWSVDAPPDDVREVLVDLERYPQWWPQVRAVAKLGEDDAIVVCRATLPYSLELRLHAVSRELPTLRVDVAGDLAGSVAWTLTEEGHGTRVDAHQEVELRGVPAALVAATRPLLSWNHHRMMRGCALGLDAQLSGRAGDRPLRRPGE